MSRAEAQSLPGVWNVPHPRNPTFTGRADDLDRLRQNFVRSMPQNPVQAIHGLGGVGKTQLALEYAYRFAGEYDVVWWLRAGEPASLAADYADLAVALHLPGSVEPVQRAAVEAVRQWLAKHDKWLVVFDGVKDPDEVASYLPRILRGHVLLTSRNSAWRNLAFPVALRPMKPSEGVELLLRASAHEDEEAAARELVKELGALPLALAQARGYIEQAGTSVGEYLRRFHDQSRELMKRGTAGPDAAPVATAWELAFQEAKERSPAAVELLDLCSFLAPDDIPADALRSARGLPPALAAAVSDDFAFDDARSVLSRYSFIEGHGDALSMHPLVQGAARDRLPAEERRAWADLAVNLVCDAFPDVPDDPAQRGACRRWLPHARAALANARAAGLPPGEPAERLLRHAAHYQHDIGFDAPAREMLIEALRTAQAVHGSDHAHVAMAHCGLGEILLRARELTGARRHAEQALRIDEKNHGPDSPHVATDLVTLAAILKEDHALDEARRHAERALRIDMILPDSDAAVARDENNLGAILRELSDREGARRCFENAIAIDQKRMAKDLPLHLNNLGLLLREMGELDEADKLTQQALALGIETYGPNDPNVATFHSNRAEVLRAMTVQNLRRALRGEAEPHLGRSLLEEARPHLEQALAIGEEVYGSDHYVVAIRSNNLGALLLDLEDYDGAKRYLDKAVSIARKALGPDHPRVRKLEINRDTAASKRKPRLVPR